MSSSTKRLVVLVLLPVVVLDTLLLPTWFVLGPSGDHAWLPIFQVFVSGLFFPLYLAVLGSVRAWRRRHDRRRAAYLLGLLLVGNLLGTFPDYIALHVSAHPFWYPSIESVHLVGFVAGLALLITVVPVMLTLLVRALLSPWAAIRT